MTSELAARERQSVIAGLDSRNDELRRLAVERVLELPVRDAIPRLVESLGDPSWRVRKAAVAGMALCRETEIVAPALIAALSDGENAGRRNSAVEALVNLGRRGVPSLVASLASDDVDVRKLLVDTVGGIGSELGRQAMIESLADCDANVRAAAADALAGIGGEAAVSALRWRAMARSEEQLVRLSCLRALARLDARVAGGDLRSVLGDPILAGAAYSLFGNLDGGEATAVLLKGLAERSRGSREAAMAALLRVLSRRDGAEFEALVLQIREAARSCRHCLDSAIDRLPDADLATRLAMVQFLGLVAEPRSVVAILEAGRDEAIAELAHATLAQLGEVSEIAIDRAWEQLDSPLRRDACRVLGVTAGPRAIERLCEALDCADAEQRIAAADALAACGCAQALPPMLRRLEIAARGDDLEDEEECESLMDALVALCAGTARCRDAAALVSEGLEAADDGVRLALVRLLGRLGHGDAAARVIPRMKDPSPEVRRAAIEALARLSPADCAEALRLAVADESHRVRIAAARALAASAGENVGDGLRRLAHDEDWRVRAATLRAIGAHERVGLSLEERLALLETALGDVGAVCVAAVEALKQLGGAGAARIATSLLARPDAEVVQAAVACIAAHGTPEQLLDLLPLVAHANWAVRAEAIEGLAEKRVTRALPCILARLASEQDAFVREVILRGLNRLEV